VRQEQGRPQGQSHLCALLWPLVENEHGACLAACFPCFRLECFLCFRLDCFLCC
jgi:hypothetical protein